MRGSTPRSPCAPGPRSWRHRHHPSHAHRSRAFHVAALRVASEVGVVQRELAHERGDGIDGMGRARRVGVGVGVGGGRASADGLGSRGGCRLGRSVVGVGAGRSGGVGVGSGEGVGSAARRGRHIGRRGWVGSVSGGDGVGVGSTTSTFSSGSWVGVRVGRREPGRGTLRDDPLPDCRWRRRLMARKVSSNTGRDMGGRHGRAAHDQMCRQ